MSLKQSIRKGETPPSASPEADFFLLEEVSKPRACLNAYRVTVWVYRYGPLIREVVLAGHAEPRTCLAASSRIIEAIKRLNDEAQWMLTAGACYFRIWPETNDLSMISPEQIRARITNQEVLQEMVMALSELAGETGLVKIINEDSMMLETFRQRFRSRAESTSAKIPRSYKDDPAQVADYLPIIPDAHPDGKALVFTLDGWDFDCPEFQAVADLHLRKMRRELLRDALRRRHTYRVWLKDWVEQWVWWLKWLQKEQAATVTLDLPPPKDQPDVGVQPVDLGRFFSKYLVDFLDRAQDWHGRVEVFYQTEPFDQKPESIDLDAIFHPKEILFVDFERGKYDKRKATAEDGFIWRERIMHQEPQLISKCLHYIRAMDSIIEPYQDLRLWHRVARGQAPKEVTKRELEASIVAEISRKIVVETMIRGWPSFYLDEKEDRAVFDAWARKYRPHVRSILEKQAKRAGVALWPLLESNIVFDVRFNEDLGCTVQPFILVDDANYAQIHSSKAGANVAVPLWSSRRSTALPQDVLELGSSNCKRAAALVKQACRYACIERPNRNEAIRCLQQAFACHPPEAGRLILQEWSERLGRDTHDEFECACYILSASELCSKFRYKEAATFVNKYLQKEPSPIADAYIIAALCELVDHETETVLRDQKEKVTKYNSLIEKVKEALGTEPANLDQQQFEKLIRREPNVRILLEAVDDLNEQIKHLDTNLKQKEENRRALMEKALRNSNLVPFEHESLEKAARVAQDALRMSMDTNCLYLPASSETLAAHYSDSRYIVEMRALLKVIHDLALIAYRITQVTDEGRRDSVVEMEQLSHSLWLPDLVEQDLKEMAKEFEKGNWDHLLVQRIHGYIEDAVDTCRHRMQDLFSDFAVTSVPLAEAVTTRIHFIQVIQGHYNTALEMLLNTKVPFGLTTGYPWTVLNKDYKEMREDDNLIFEQENGIVCLISSNKRVPLLQTGKMSDAKSDYIGRIVAEPGLLNRLQPHAQSLAERILATEVEPGPEWMLWRDLMAAVKDELLLTMANFSEASLIPEDILPKTPEGEAMYRWMDSVPPRGVPVVNMGFE